MENNLDVQVHSHEPTEDDLHHETNCVGKQHE